MTITALSGPLVVFGQTPAGVGPTPDYNPELGPSLFYGGVGLLDQRLLWGYEPGQNFGNQTNGWLGVDRVTTTVYTPSALSANNIANTTPTSGTALTLLASPGAGITINGTVVNANTGATVTGLRIIDALTGSATAGTISGNTFTAASATGSFTVGSILTGTGVQTGTEIIAIGPTVGGNATYTVNISQTVSSTTITGIAGTLGIPTVPFGSAGTINLYNPACMLSRNVRITTAGGDTAVYTVAGYDAYGFPMTEAITANGATTVSGKKAFKYISSITPVGTVGATVTVGTGDVYGFPIFSSTFTDVTLYWAGSLITSSTGYTAGVTTAATTTTGDVRGTYATQSASNGSNQLVIIQSPSVVNVGSMTGLFGVNQA